MLQSTLAPALKQVQHNLQVSGGDVVLGDEGLLQRDDLVGASVRVEGRLDLGEENDGAVGATTGELATGLGSGRERDGVVEGQTEGLVGLLCALVVEKVLHNIVPNRE